MKLNKYISILIIIIVTVLAFLIFFNGCQKSDELIENKNVRKIDLQNYAYSKLQSNYTSANRRIIQDIVYAGINEIDTSININLVESVFYYYIMLIDGVLPVISERITENAFLLTDNSWAYYVHNIAKEFDKDDQWIQTAIECGEIYHGETLINSRDNMWVVIIDNMITLSHDNKKVYEIFQDKGLYIGKSAQESINIYINGDNLYINRGNETMSYKRNINYRRSADMPIKLRMPEQVEVNAYSLRWRYPNEFTSDLLGGKVDVQYPDSNFFQTVAIKEWIPFPYGFFDIVFNDIKIKEGINNIRLCHLGGPNLSHVNKEIYLSLSSDYTYIKLKMDNGNIYLID